jgi:hypothetical protein
MVSSFRGLGLLDFNAVAKVIVTYEAPHIIPSGTALVTFAGLIGGSAIGDFHVMSFNVR